ncbi:MAG: hypothetical protein WD793_02065 [Steroidobacteraceae bacterium]
MKHNALLIVTSLLAMLFASVQVVHDVVVGIEEGSRPHSSP